MSDVTDEQAREAVIRHGREGDTSVPLNFEALGRALLTLEARCEALAGQRDGWSVITKAAQASRDEHASIASKALDRAEAAEREVAAMRAVVEAARKLRASFAEECWCHGIQGSHDDDCPMSNAESAAWKELDGALSRAAREKEAWE